MAKNTEMVKHDASSMVRATNGTTPDEKIAQGYSVEVQHTLVDGQEIEGTLMGAGAKVEFTNPKTGEVSSVGTWRLRDDTGNVIVNLLGSSQLDARLGSLKEGTRVLIQHKGQVRTKKGMLANNYLIYTKSPA